MLKTNMSIYLINFFFVYYRRHPDEHVYIVFPYYNLKMNNLLYIYRN